MEHAHVAGGVGAVGEQSGEVGAHGALQALPGARHTDQGFLDRCADQLDAAVEHLGEDLVLGGEVVVDAPRLDAHGVGDRPQAGLDITLVEEPAGGLVEEFGSRVGGGDRHTAILVNLPNVC